MKRPGSGNLFYVEVKCGLFFIFAPTKNRENVYND